MWEYDDIARKLLTEAKYHESFDIYHDIHLNIAQRLSNLQKDALKRLDHSLLQPIPQHTKRTIRRGFDHTESIANAVESALKETEPSFQLKKINLLIKKKNNKRQASLSKDDRQINIKNVYLVNRKVLKKIKKHNKILLIDDVMTTGSTIVEATKTIRDQLTQVEINALVLFRGKTRFSKVYNQNPTGQIIMK